MKTNPKTSMEDRFENQYPHGLFELPEFCEQVKGVSPRGVEYKGMAINKKDILAFINAELLANDKQWETKLREAQMPTPPKWMKDLNIRSVFIGGARELLDSLLERKS